MNKRPTVYQKCSFQPDTPFSLYVYARGKLGSFIYVNNISSVIPLVILHFYSFSFVRRYTV